MNRDELRTALADFPGRVADAALAAADRPVPAGEWGANQVIRHLIAVELDVHQARLDDLATSDDPHWDWAEPAPWPGEPDLSLDQLLERFRDLRMMTLATVDAIGPLDWVRSGTHTTVGVLDVGGVLENARGHDEDHLAGLTRPGA